ncbi:hypothetical protein CCYA_CCYA15G3940 [Cyanidiococcus yangmingshanensis]|nr:hypothetical protein CCYA_CCYA15G3940 [Cyanidiococcus yangmingshanensis]
MSKGRYSETAVVFEHHTLPDSSDDEVNADCAGLQRDATKESSRVEGRSLQTASSDSTISLRGLARERPTGRKTFGPEPGRQPALHPQRIVPEAESALSSEMRDADEALFQKFCASLLSPTESVVADDRLFEDDVEFDYWKAYVESKEPNEEFRADTGARISSEELYQLVAEEVHKAAAAKEPTVAEDSQALSGAPSCALSDIPERRPRSRRGARSAENLSSDCNRLFQLLKFKLLEPEQERELSKQIHVHVQLLLHILLISSQRRANIHLAPDHVVRRQRAREAAWLMLDDLRRKRDVAREYRRVLGGIERTFFDAPPLDLLGDVERHVVRPALLSPDGLITVAEAKYAYALLRSRSGILLPEYELSCGVDIESNRVLLQGLDTGSRATLSWTKPEDTLLERCLSRHGVLWQEHLDDFLPQRSLEECIARYRQLTRRDAPENPVKTLKLKAQHPLSVEEIERLRQGVMTYGECWDAIQAFMLPGRDKVLLERVWKRLSLRARKELRRRRRRRRVSLRDDSGELLWAMSSVNGEQERSVRSSVHSEEAGALDTDMGDHTGFMETPFSRQEDRELLLLIRQHLGSMDEASVFELIAQKMETKRTPDAYRDRARELISLL